VQASTDIDDGFPVRLARSRLYSQRGSPSDRAKLAQLADGVPATFTKESTARLQRALAEAWLRLNEPARAEKLLRDVSSALPRDLGSRLMLLDLAIERRQFTAARLLLDEIRAIDGESVRWRIGAIALQIQEARGDRSQLEDARRKLQALEKTYKNSPRIALMNATICERLNEPQKAIRDYSRALELGEMRPQTLGRLMQLLVARRDYGAAEAEILKFERLAPLPKELARVGAEVAMGLRDERYAKVAAARAELALTKPIRDYRDALWLARIYQAAGENAKAESLLKDTIEEAGYAPDVWIEWMKFLAATEQRKSGSHELERMAKTVSEDRVELTMARCLVALRQPQEAGGAFQKALRERPEDFATLRFAAEFFERADNTAEAQKLYEYLLDPTLAVPADTLATVRRRLAVLLANTSRRRALDLLDANKKAAAHDKSDERVRLYVQSFNSPAARQDSLEKFQKSFHRTPPTADERVLYAQMLNAGNLPGQASAQLAEAVNEQPTNAQYVARYIQQLLRGNDFDGAERQLKRLEELEPSSERSRNLRVLLANAKDPK
jgi:Tfp pilus assembly protein PilF